ncbi:ephrin type-A receptor 2-like isoform X2 [Corticium candelabrum]|uniref:ephrin type-A receptor 2-like isoform X2 n=1 Tax=Corticium candelabrum TaxID=121492 RepID=UPI002E2638D2|nr:ephrin type-A receptor 2-like isoform X2 [Corticium candelabrum]
MFETAGYPDTSSFIEIQGEEIKFALGVQKADLVQRIIRAIDELPDTSVPLGVPNNVSDWLKSLGLSQYQQQFVEAGYEGRSDIVNLVSLNQDILKNEIGVTKPGHLKKLQMALENVKHSTNREMATRQVKSVIDDLHKRSMAASPER